MVDVVKIKGEVESVLVQAGEILLSYFGNDFKIHNKENMGLVTEADFKAEAFLIKKLTEIFPEASFWAEESGVCINDSNGDYCWVIDPLDGTTNFARTLPYFCISVCLTYKNEPILGFIYQPLLKELFFAQKGKGAFLNDNPIKISNISEKNGTLLAVAVPYKMNSSFYERFSSIIDNTLKDYFAFRHFGAVALDLAYVACGRFDALFFEELFWWDFSAGSLIVEEAGGIVSDFNDQKIGPNSKSVIASNAAVHSDLIQLVGSKME